MLASSVICQAEFYMSTVAILGASNNPERIAYQALSRLLAEHYDVIPVSPKGGEILGQRVLTSLAAIDRSIDTLTMYVGPERHSELLDAIVALQPRRIIFNPGSENPALYPRLQQAGIEIQEACTLVLLATHQFDLPA
jgi:predicted CoA-binding protein